MEAPLDLPNYNNTDYPLAVQNQLAALDYTASDQERLRYHQFVTKEFFSRSPHLRGLLIAHAQGTGKTRLAVAIADHYSTYDPRRKINVLLPKALEANFRKTVRDYAGRDDNYINSHYSFVSLNASNMLRQMKNIDKTNAQRAFDKKLGTFIERIDNALDGTLLIIDEAHNLFNSITNGSKNALGLYDMIIKAKNLRLIFLTGTPIVNDPFELIACFNMLRGSMRVSVDKVQTTEQTTEQTAQRRGFGHRMRDRDTTLLFSESIAEFNDFFVDRAKNTIKNSEKFMNRIYGLTSYIGSVYLSPTDTREGFPIELPTIVERVEMSDVQYALYAAAREAEVKDEAHKGYRQEDARFSASAGGSSTYRVKSRQLSNYAIPEYARGPVRGRKTRLKFIDKIKDEDLRDVQFSPKMHAILNNITQDGHAMVYSNYVSGEGLAIFAKILLLNGWALYSHTAPVNSSKRTFMVLSGSVAPSLRAEVIEIFNSAANREGAVIRLLLLSSALAEGIDLKRIRQVHIMEPFWNYARIGQIKARAIRYLSHEDLPEDQRNVQVYVYLSDYPKLTDTVDREDGGTTDVSMYERALSNMMLIDTFMRVVAESSIDCGLNYPNLPDEVKKNVSCKLCAPNNRQLFHPLISKDMLLPSSCVPYSETNVEVTEVFMPETGEKFYYTIADDEPVLYLFNSKLDGYVPMDRGHPYFGQLMVQIADETHDDEFGVPELD